MVAVLLNVTLVLGILGYFGIQTTSFAALMAGAGHAIGAPQVSLLDMNLVGPVIAVRPYTHNDHYWQVYFDTNEAIVRVSREAGWPSPTPSQIVRQA